ncbi:MAG: LemA family protein [Oscillospiraceae bacterium]|nr:LemA family protein [Oscillospiraceae bacterium]MDD4414588.1 LemA family protein [Oscillospiraceae bacterium]
MKKSLAITLGAIGGLILIILIWGIASYNGIVTAETTVEEKASTIQVDLQRRADLVPNLVETVKGYATHEEKIFTELADARARLGGAKTIEEQEAANNELSGALSRLMVIVENYPDLKASKNFENLQVQLEGTENRIKISRTDYNKAVKDYNLRLRRFPSSIIAGIFGFEKADMFEGQEGIDTVPQVNF